MELFTIGHGTADETTFLARLDAATVRRIVDVRRFPASRRWPWFNAEALANWLPEHGIEYVAAPQLGGRRKPLPDSPNTVLREAGFRGFADYMATGEFRTAFDALVTETAAATTAVMCSETLWWRCHRRLIADAAVLLREATVIHLVGTARQPHKVTPGARAAGATVIYSGDNG